MQNEYFIQRTNNKNNIRFLRVDFDEFVENSDDTKLPIIIFFMDYTRTRNKVTGERESNDVRRKNVIEKKYLLLIDYLVMYFQYDILLKNKKTAVETFIFIKYCIFCNSMARNSSRIFSSILTLRIIRGDTINIYNI